MSRRKPAPGLDPGVGTGSPKRTCANEGHAPMNESRAWPDSAGTGRALARSPDRFVREHFRKIFSLCSPVDSAHPARSSMLAPGQTLEARAGLLPVMTVLAGATFGGAVGGMILERNASFIRSYLLAQD